MTKRIVFNKTPRTIKTAKVTAAQVRKMLAAGEIQEAGIKETGKRGRPAKLYVTA